MPIITEEIINGEVYTVTGHDSGHITKELKMTEAQKAILAVKVEPVDSSADILKKLDKIIALLEKR